MSNTLFDKLSKTASKALRGVGGENPAKNPALTPQRTLKCSKCGASDHLSPACLKPKKP